MYIWIDCEGSEPELREPETFNEFKLVVAGATGMPVASREAARIGRIDGDDHVSVDPALVGRLAGDRADDPEWRRGFEAMVEYARTKGWIDDGGGIRAHIELQ